MRKYSHIAVLMLLAASTPATPAVARPGGWDSPAWGAPGWGRPVPGAPRPESIDRSREGRISVDRFVAEGDAASALGRGAISVSSGSDDADFVDLGERAAYEAAVIDRLVDAGYDTTQAKPTGGQIAELRVIRRQLEPAEQARKPVSGEAAMEVGTRGTSYGLAVAVDLSKPRPPLISTRLEARIRDRATGTVLWEGRADVATRSGDERWNEQTIAAKLAEALFDGFPAASTPIAAALRPN